MDKEYIISCLNRRIAQLLFDSEEKKSGINFDEVSAIGSLVNDLLDSKNIDTKSQVEVVMEHILDFDQDGFDDEEVYSLLEFYLVNVLKGPGLLLYYEDYIDAYINNLNELLKNKKYDEIRAPLCILGYYYEKFDDDVKGSPDNIVDINKLKGRRGDLH